MEGFIPIFSLILIDPKFIAEQSNTNYSYEEGRSFINEMNNLLDIYELVDISSSSEEEGEIRASTPLPRDDKEYPKIIVEILNSSAEATTDGEEFLDLSPNSLETECKRMKLDESYTSFGSEESDQYQQSERSEEIIADSPESPNESMSSDIFVVEASTNNEESIISSKVAGYLEKVRQEDSSSYFITPPGTPRKIYFRPASPLNDLDDSHMYDTAQNGKKLPSLTLMPRQPGNNVPPRSVVLSQPAPGLGCNCRRIGIGRGHGCNLRFPRW